MTEAELLFSVMSRLCFMQSHVAGIWSSLKHIIRGTEMDYLPKCKATTGFVKCEIGDLIKQTKLLAETLDVDYKECEQLGEERYQETKTNFPKDKRWL
jgi:hypothetical protein